MTIEELYALLRSKTYYQEEGSKRFSFTGNSIHVDRRALIPFEIYIENESFYLNPDTAIAGEKELRIVTENKPYIQFYGKSSGEKLLTLQ